MQPKFFLLLIFISIYSFSHGQIKKTGSLSGIISDEVSGIPLAGATIKLDKLQRTAVSDADGKFKIENLPAGIYTATVSYVGYESKQLDEIKINETEITPLAIALTASKSTLKDVVVKTDARRENISGALVLRKNLTVVSDIISAEQIRRSPDKNTSDVLKRISGTTIQENKFVVVRGMNDRYNEAMLNNALLPSSEPDRKTFAFDIFPADVVDNITIIKTASPDLPASFSGGLIQINTKDVPDRNFIAVKAGIGYNTITTGKTYYQSPTSGTDWLGYDDGLRKLPANFPDASKYYLISIKRKANFSQQLKNLWKFTKEDAPLNTSFQLTGGFSTTPHNTNYPKLGGTFGVVYNSTYNFNNVHHYDYRNAGNTDTIYKYNDSAFTRSILASALADFSLRINQNNKFIFNNILSINSSDQNILRDGYSFDNQWNVKANAAFFVSNRIYNTQFGGDHFLPKSKLRIKWLAYYTDLFRNEPDYRRNQYVDIGTGYGYFALITQTANSNYGSRYFATVKDKTKGANVDLSLPFKLLSNTQTFKIGAALYKNDRTREARVISAITTSGFNSGPLGYLYWAQDSIFNRSNFNKDDGFVYQELIDYRNNYTGSINNAAAYAMLDNKFTQKLRLIWGFRWENYHQILNTFDDGQQPLLIDTTYHDLLPSANFIYSVLPKANVRLSYSKTLARPQYRELAPAIFYDFLTNTSFFGDPALTETHIDNYDLRWEHYFPNAQYYSVGGFYKKFRQPIEQYVPFPGADSKTVSARNDSIATNYGIEIEGRKDFSFVSKSLQNLIFYANASLIKSKVTQPIADGKDSSNRPLQGQSPYVINVSLQYTEPKTNLGVSVLYNTIGDRLFLVGGAPGQGTDAIWEKPHSSLDAKLTKTFLKNGLVEFSLADILHKNDIFYYDENGNKKYNEGADRIIAAKTNGMRFTFSIGYKF